MASKSGKSSKSSSSKSGKTSKKTESKANLKKVQPGETISASSSSSSMPTSPAKQTSNSNLPSMAASSSSAASSSAASSSSPVELAPTGELTHHLALSPEYSKFTDVTFQLAGGDQLFAHSWVLDVRCPRLGEMAAKKRPPVKKGQKRKHSPVSIDFANFPIAHVTIVNKDTLQLTLNYIYADNVNVDEIEPMRVMFLAMSARTFDLPRLLRLCEIRLQTCLTLDNVYELLKVAHDNKEKRIRDFCMDFAHRHIKEFVSQKERLKDLGMELMQEIVDISLDTYVEPAKTDNPVPESTLIQDFQRLWEATEKGDMWADAYVQIGQSRIPFHKAMFAAHAKAFAQVLPPSGTGDDVTEALCLCAPAKGKGDGKSPVFKIEPDTFLVLVRYIYFGCTRIDPLLACNIAPFLPRFQLGALQQVCQHTISVNIKPDTVLDILRVAYMPEYSDREDIRTIKGQALQFCATHGKEIILEPLLSMDQRIAVDILKTIQAN